MKKASKILLTLALAISLVMPTLAAPVDYGAELENQPSKSYAQKFSDVPKSHWAFNYVAEMADRNVLNGYPDGRFYPENNVTRGEFAKIMTLAAGLPLDTNATSSYTDVRNSDWYCPYIETARYYLSGYSSNGGNYYKPNDNALREDIAVALVKLKGYSTDGFDLSILQAMFTDWQSISAGAQKYVAVAVEQGLISGYEDRTFRGQAGVTRAETATLLWRAYQYGSGNKDFEQEDVKKQEPEIKNPAPEKQPEKEPEKKPEKEEVKKPEQEKEPEKTPEPAAKKTHYIDTLADGYNVRNTFVDATIAGNTLYFYDEDDKVIYALDTTNGNVKKHLDVGKLVYEEYDEEEVFVSVESDEDEDEDEQNEDVNEEDVASDDPKGAYETQKTLVGTYSDYELQQIYYNDATNELLMLGEYKSYQSARSYKKQELSVNDRFTRNYEISNEPIIYDKEIVPNNDYSIRGHMNDGRLITANGHITASEYVTGGREPSNVDDSVYIGNDFEHISFKGGMPYYFESGRTIFAVGMCSIYDHPGSVIRNPVTRTYEYDFASHKWNQLWDDAVPYDCVGFKNGVVKQFNIDCGVMDIYTIKLDGKPAKETIDLGNVDVLDFEDIPYVTDSDFMFINDNDDLIFYDGGRWRIFGEY